MCSKQNRRVNLNIFNMVTEINESKALTKHISSQYEYKFVVRKCNLNQKWNIIKCWCKCKNPEEYRV